LPGSSPSSGSRPIGAPPPVHTNGTSPVDDGEEMADVDEGELLEENNG
jgi:hypothetical protein